MSIEIRDLLRAIIKAEGLSYEQFAKKIGVTFDVIEHSVRKNSCSDRLVEALSKYYGTDYSFLQRDDTRQTKNRRKCTKNTNITEKI